MGSEKPVASGFKIAHHRERIEAYLAGREIYPVTLEFDLTSRCSRECRDCPSTRARKHWAVTPRFVKRLFSLLGGRVPGLLLTGGEPTISPLFASTLAQARDSGFREIAVVTNGSQLDDEKVRAALLAHASAIRVSLYDWEQSLIQGADRIFERLAGLRARIDGDGSRLRIGVSALTSARRLPKLGGLVAAAAQAGVHWIYFHPRCRHWDVGRPQPEDQRGVLEEIARLRRKHADRIEIDVSWQRYQGFPLRFSSYHAAHFMLVVGADRKNYLGAEVKYHPDYVIADLGEDITDGFLWRPSRRERIAAVDHVHYRALSSRHRGVLYNDFIERLRDRDQEAEAILATPPGFAYPDIL